MTQDAAQKTELPTPRRLEEAAERGQVPMSRELVAAGALLLGTLVLMTVGPWLRTALEGSLRIGLSPADVDGELFADPASVARGVRAVLGDLFEPALVVLLVGMAGALIFGFAQIGFRVRSKALRVEAARLSPARNLKRMFSWTSVVATGVALAKVVAIVGVTWIALSAAGGQFLTMHDSSLDEAVGTTMALTFRVLYAVVALMTAVALFDLAWQRTNHTRQLRMSRKEVEEERKRSEGDPAVKGRQRAAAMELSRNRMIENVSKADVVITNPTHFAVAISYDRERHAAPVVLAKGVDDFARQIRMAARESSVPIMEDPPLARALWRAVRVGDQIPERFFKAVATVLGHVLGARREAES